MSDDDRPARSGLETGLRLGCGGLLGLLLGVLCAFGLADGDGPKLVAVTSVSVVVCAGLAWRYGERFWRWVGDVLTYWWP
jgi:hypothetical protein